MKPMKLTETTAFPQSTGWVAEPKYDGYRCLVSITDTSIELISRNGRLLNHAFPEVVSAFEERRTKLSNELPLVLDGELVCLLNGYASHFPAVQTRSRMSNVHVIEKEMVSRPCQWIAFDILNQPNVPYRERRKQLLSFCKRADIPLTPLGGVPTLGVVESTSAIQALLTTVKRYNGEGIVLKKQLSPYNQNIRSKDWL
ncbi:ATP-dependent DNA ligase, partial [Alkalihalobacillus clausii]|uniref:ATP-dependent DNA ligase n=2 Tax=Bacillaceae TaxID=186817 RepID=UPI00263B88D8